MTGGITAYVYVDESNTVGKGKFDEGEESGESQRDCPFIGKRAGERNERQTGAGEKAGGGGGRCSWRVGVVLRVY